MKVQILGGGCANCEKLQKNTEEALKELNIDTVIEKVKDFKEIMAMGVMKTPALAIDGKILVAGYIAKAKEIVKLINKIK
ncbi:MAG: TM0996/MTH895 family glutaredoxin-like protein [Clostridia bacterium]|nr:TM0996/MTH895 family glutaredoxin-like protein [Clostridia bacterium]